MKPRLRSRSRLAIGFWAQGKTLRRVAGYWCLYHFLFWHLLFLHRYLEYRGDLLAGAQALGIAQLYADFAARHAWILACAALLLPLVAWDALRLTHRMIGPLARFRHCLKLLARGERVTQIQVRRGDFLVELQHAFNEFLDSPYNTRRWVDVPRAAAGETHSADRISPKDGGELVLDSIQQIQASLWEVRAPHAMPEPVAMSPRVTPTPVPDQPHR